MRLFDGMPARALVTARTAYACAMAAERLTLDPMAASARDWYHDSQAAIARLGFRPTWTSMEFLLLP